VSAGGDADWEREALRLNRRYLDEVVLAFGLCPWAEPALQGGRVRRAVCLAPLPQASDCLPFIDQLDQFAAADAPQVDIGLLLFPRASLTWSAFDTFAERVRRVKGIFLVASFHPDGPLHAENPHQAIPFLRRSPDPMLQFVRAALIDRLHTTQPGISASVGERNFRSLQGGAQSRLNAVLDDIRLDRATTYARLTS
jgi:hypothetical protein